MANSYFAFKKFTVQQDQCAMKVGTDGVLLGAWAQLPASGDILDIGTGTGLIALMMAQRSQNEITAIEIEPLASQQAQENVDRSLWSDRIRVIPSSIQDFSLSTSKRFATVVSNPPFFSNSLKNPNEQKTLARHNDTLLPGELLTAVKRVITPEGSFSLILPYVESSLFLVDAALEGLYCQRKTLVKSSLTKKPHRVLLELKSSRIKAEESELIIYNPDGQYTEAYRELTQDFYLSF